MRSREGRNQEEKQGGSKQGERAGKHGAEDGEDDEHEEPEGGGVRRRTD